MSSRWIRRSIAAVIGLVVLTAATPPDDTSTLTELAPAVLSGRTIVIDPGHGGPGDTGAVSPGGLKESHINLMVGLRLAEILRRQGANVLLTRTTDAFVASDDGVVDLAARAAVANDAMADLFLSIHHNDTLTKGDPRNDTQVYWKLDDQGPSKDFAEILLPRLAKSLGMARQQLIAGNFAVLRRNRRPAVLGEGAYLSNPVSARQLTQASTWQREAEAYAAAIGVYFGRGVPRFGDLSWQTADRPDAGRMRAAATTTAAFPKADHLSLTVAPDGGALSSVTLYVDDKPAAARYDAGQGSLAWTPEHPLANGLHTVRAEARNVNGNAAIPFVGSILVDRPAARISALSVPMSWHPEASDMVIIRAGVHDALGLPVADGTPVVVRWGDQRTIAGTVLGSVAVTLPWPGRGPVPVEIQAGSAATRLPFGATAQHTYLNVSVQGWGSDVPAAAMSLDNQTLLAPDSPGVASYETTPGIHRLSIGAPGYEPWSDTIVAEVGRVATARIALVPMYDGVLIGCHIMLDPFVSDTRPEQADRTLGLARSLKERLTAAGAVVTLSRSGDEALSAAERCRLMGRTGCDLYIGLDLGGGQVGHYYTSARGSKVARFITQQLKGYSLAPEAGYLVTHSPCTGVVVKLRSTTMTDADRLFEALRRFYAAQ